MAAPPTELRRKLVMEALKYARSARLAATKENGRLDCLNQAVRALEGALKNIEFEIKEAKKKCPVESK
jgi:hypothetical protein